MAVSASPLGNSVRELKHNSHGGEGALAASAIAFVRSSLEPSR
jgi:hypothetical protein